jgi:hypothetical protein
MKTSIKIILDCGPTNFDKQKPLGHGALSQGRSETNLSISSCKMVLIQRQVHVNSGYILRSQPIDQLEWKPQVRHEYTNEQSLHSMMIVSHGSIFS